MAVHSLHNGGSTYIAWIYVQLCLEFVFWKQFNTRTFRQLCLIGYLPIDGLSYTAKNYELQQLVENRIEQCCAVHIVQCCRQYCSALLNLIVG